MEKSSKPKTLDDVIKHIELLGGNLPNRTSVAQQPSSLTGLLPELKATEVKLPGGLVAKLVDDFFARLDISKSPLNTEEVIDAYLTYMADVGNAEGYLKVRARKLRFFARQYPELPTSPEPIRAYLRQFKTADVPTRQDQWKALSALYKFASDTYGLPNLMLKIDKPHFRKKPGQRLSRDQAEKFISVVNTDLEWAIVTCYFGLRLRRIEAERMLYGDIKSDFIVVRGKERTEELPLLPVFRDKLFKLVNNHNPNDPLFSIKADTMAYHIGRLFQRAGIIDTRGSPHTLRNTAGPLWLTYGGDDRSNRQLLRHSPQTMTDHYSVLSLDELRAMEQRFNPMLNLMRELGLAPGSVPVPLAEASYQNTTGGQVKSTPNSTLS